MSDSGEPWRMRTISKPEGEAKTVKSGDTVTVHYVGTLPDGNVFDSSRAKGRPFSFEAGGDKVIFCWAHGLMNLKVGQRVKIISSPMAAYGPVGTPDGPIPP